MGFLRIREFGKGDLLLCSFCGRLCEVDYNETFDKCPHCGKIQGEEEKEEEGAAI